MSKKTRGSSLGVVALSALVAIFMIAQQIASKAVRDGFFLSQFDVTSLPAATLAASFVSFGAAILLGKFIATFTPRAAVPVIFGINGLLFFAEAGLVESNPGLVAWALYLHTAAFGGAVVSGFWSVINERFDPFTARQVMGRIAGGATFGGVVGGVLTWTFSDAPMLLLLLAFGATSTIGALLVGFIARGSTAERTPGTPTKLFSGIGTLFQSRYPRAIGLLVFLGAAMTGMVDYVFKAEVSGITESGGLVGFFAVFYTVVGVVTFAVQALGTKRVLDRLGVVGTVAALPAAALVLCAIAVLSPTLFVIVALRGGAMVVENSLYRSGYELLYTAVPPAQKRSAKVLIDLGLDRVGTAAASGLALLVIAISVDNVERPLLLTSLAVSVATLATLMIIRREYVASLAQQLRDALIVDPGADPSMSLAGTFMSESVLPMGVFETSEHSSAGALAPVESWADVLVRVKERAAEKATEASDEPLLALPRSEVAEELLATPLRERLRSVSSGDAEWSVLQRSAPGTVGQLGDLLLSAREPLEVRLRAAQLLAEVPTRRSMTALIEALSAAELPVRRTAALALLAISEISVTLRPERSVLTALAVSELTRPAGPNQQRRWFELQSPFIEDARGRRLSPSLELVFVLLAIDGDTAELRLALTAITSADPMKRGTGLEYLDNLLPGDLRHRVLALAQNHELTSDDQKMSPELLGSLADDLRAGSIDVAQLRRRYRKARQRRWQDQAADR